MTSNLLLIAEAQIEVDDEPEYATLADLHDMTADDLVNDPSWEPNSEAQDIEEPITSANLNRESFEAMW